ncbi:MAG: hypothetical protein HYS69_05205, partial [candidate division NC10 bacterium]|nr:hypothetical protein [candidate division NC10 bacterium]
QFRAALGYAAAYPEEITRQIARNEKWTRDRLAKEHPTLAAGPRWGTTWITIHAFNAHEAHHGVLLVSHRLPGDRFALLARALADYAARHPRGLPRYTVDFL